MAASLAETADLFDERQIKKANLPEQVAKLIEQMIIDDNLSADDRLPSERDLAIKLKVGRGTINQALGFLEHQGLITRRLGLGGTVVNGTLSPDTIGQSIERYFLFRCCSMDDVMNCRAMFEPETAALAAIEATEEDKRNLLVCAERIEQEFNRSPLDIDRYAEADYAFHQTLALASHNDLVIAISQGVHNVVKQWIRVHAASKLGSTPCMQHRAIYEAICHQDSELAKTIMQEHMLWARRSLKKIKTENEGGDRSKS